MAQIGCLGDILFVVSAETVRTLNNMKWSGSARYAAHNRHGTHALTEFTGLDPDKITFSLRLLSELGAEPMESIVKLWGYERSGEPVPLVVGDKGYGKFRWSVVSHSAALDEFDGAGNVTGATVTVTLQEYLLQ